ncbi:MAG: CDP-diacylglycerol--glycerol-3-phosphate 3-phosphatidyltransferase [Ruminococcus sp.]|jgi:CDP-diacylglycerol--glycerol-3-phosphate 3-phosphatidyltransferase|nr:CDP-diacylglycerol--glycerol-3-phosphate 3-phosphatidyltransferase [Ruminococcus sp.]
MKLNLPNKLTVLRVILVIPFLGALYLMRTEFFGSDTPKISAAIALFIFALASFTDFLDGYIARKYKLITTFGKFMDPLADKILTVSALIYFCTIWPFYSFGLPVILIIIREFTVSGLRLVTADKGVVVPANIWGKLKTAFTMIAIITVLVFMITGMNNLMIYIALGLVWVSAILTLISGFVYIKAYAAFLTE